MQVLDALRALAVRVDGWANALSGLGTSRDKSTHWQFQFRGQVEPDLLAASYLDSDVSAAVANKVPKIGLRRGVVVNYEGRESTEIRDAMAALGALEEVRRAWIWSRLIGGAAVLMLTDDPAPSMAEPLAYPVRSVRGLVTLDRRDVVADHRLDLRGRPLYYRCYFTAGAILVHRSRLLLFQGDDVPRREERERQYWGVGTVERAWDEIRDYDAAWAAIRHLINDANQGVFKVQDLLSVIANGAGSALIERMKILDQTRSVARALVLDADGESFDRIATSFAGLADILEKAAVRLAQAANMPVTVLLGISPAGLNATGESDIRNWYAEVESERSDRAEPQILRLAQIIALTRGLDPRLVSLEWPSLWSMTEPEQNEADQGRLGVLQTAEGAGYVEHHEARAAWRAEQGLPEDEPPESGPAGGPPDPRGAGPDDRVPDEPETDDRVETIVRIDLTYGALAPQVPGTDEASPARLDGAWTYALMFEGGGKDAGALPHARASCKLGTLLRALRREYEDTPALAAQLYSIRPGDFVSLGSGYRWSRPVG